MPFDTIRDGLARWNTQRKLARGRCVTCDAILRDDATDIACSAACRDDWLQRTAW